VSERERKEKKRRDESRIEPERELNKKKARLVGWAAAAAATSNNARNQLPTFSVTNPSHVSCLEKEASKASEGRRRRRKRAEEKETTRL
jgi:hypothetical protein